MIKSPLNMIIQFMRLVDIQHLPISWNNPKSLLRFLEVPIFQTLILHSYTSNLMKKLINAFSKNIEVNAVVLCTNLQFLETWNIRLKLVQNLKTAQSNPANHVSQTVHHCPSYLREPHCCLFTPDDGILVQRGFINILMLLTCF